METTTDLADTPLADLLTRARELALAEDPEAAHETLWETVEALRGPHAGEEVFEAALGWSGDAEPQVRALGRYPKVLGVDFPITVQVEDAHVVLRARARRRRFAAQVLRGRLHDGRLPSRQGWMWVLVR